VAKHLIKMLKGFPKNVFLALVLFLVTITLLNSEKQRMNLRTLGMQAQIKADQETIYKLEQLIQERPNYRDGWIQLAVAYYKNNDKGKALEALQKAKQIDPNNETLLQIEELWSN
jgi:cytochrome c-type biogenesis protein CcmH/NrfG